MSKPLVVEYNPELDLSATTCDKDELIKDARMFLATLAPRQARISKWYYTDGHSLEQIADFENTTVNSIKKVIQRVNKKLKERYA